VSGKPICAHEALRALVEIPKMSRMNSGPQKVVCFAVKQEARFFQRLAQGRSEGRVLLTGMGYRNAARVLRALLESTRPDLVVSAGFAGGVKAGLARGTVLFANTADATLKKALLAAGAEPGQFHFAKRVVTRAVEKERLYQDTRADAVEMESQTICAVCREHQ